MLNVSVLRRKFILQFLGLLLPVTAILIFQSVTHIYKSNELERAFFTYDYSNSVKNNYNKFLDGVVDAIDTEQLSSDAVNALGQAVTNMEKLDTLDTTANLSSIVADMKKMHSAFESDRSLDTIFPLKDIINGTANQIKQLSADYQEKNRTVIEGNIQSTKDAQVAIGVILALTIVLSIWIIKVIVQKITRPLSAAVDISVRIANGELSRIDENSIKEDIGHLLESLNSMNQNLFQIVTKVKTTANSIAQSADTASSEASHVVSSIAEQSTKIEKANNSIRDICQCMSDDVNQNAVQAVNSAKETLELAKTGNANMSKSIEATERIVGSVGSSAELIHALSNSIQKISEITGIIKGIADQTNLLALNAAIEAARAGEQGRGFAVVADDVRKLSEKTSVSTSDITRIINEISNQSRDVVEAMTVVKDDVELGAGYNRTTGDILTQIVTAIGSVSEQVKEIADSAMQQSNEGQSILENIEQVSSMASDNMQSMQHMQQSAKDLASISNEMQQIVGQFKIQA
ncbi:MAG: methyl-accepting chemotaxis protein [Nitrospira sp.]|nr:methyl-accepting chemotaxis protein [Nitrospira sp.]